MRTPTARVFDDEEGLAIGTAGAILFASMEAVARRGRFHWAAAGGSTPRATYAAISRPPFSNDFPWGRHDTWLGDERLVAPGHPASNATMIRQHLYRPAAADPGSLHVFDTAGDPEDAALAYAEDMEATLPSNRDGIPVLDLVLLGLGADAHTASWFPGSRFPEDRWVAVVEERAGYRRLTLTPTVVNAARQVVFLVSGAAKHAALRRVLDGSKDPVRVPAQRVRPTRGTVSWMLDAAAAGQFFSG